MKELGWKSELLEELSYIAVPKSVLRRFVFGRSVRCFACIIFAGLLILPLTVIPGLILLVLPAEVILISRIHDESELIRWVRCNMEPGKCNMGDAELETEMIRLRSHNRPDALQDYFR